MHIPEEAWLPLAPHHCAPGRMYPRAERWSSFQEKLEIWVFRIFLKMMKQKTNLHKPSDWIQPIGCHFATSGLEVKCRITQTWGQMLVLPLVTM